MADPTRGGVAPADFAGEGGGAGITEGEFLAAEGLQSDAQAEAIGGGEQGLALAFVRVAVGCERVRDAVVFNRQLDGDGRTYNVMEVTTGIQLLKRFKKEVCPSPA